MNRKANDSIVTVIGIDIGKNTFHLVGRNRSRRRIRDLVTLLAA